ncbi:C-terminal processing peptidase-1 [Desulfocapsa sulfexigens DSM 10523]|uniref:C-terminal processing peptidase-1 n=1 Tax=Desulfocapsa sulfexigens (strain DSM 10523 / SB164P1) TaxID=1167006 RepID=M1NAE6_DESSD|nr:carboxy terminal-processing peptidase [Desulfocapsa sulfexigens]AGF76829.1 C-terminal processing peptidase-1 [Desulfocapsa sulfexigens DSM 10523]
MIKIFRLFLGCIVVISFFLPAVSPAKSSDSPVADVSRNKIIGFMISKQLPVMHFSDKVMNDELAFAAFDLYLKQLDYQKRFLLQSDVDKLSVLAPAIDNNLVKGDITLPDVGYEVLATRIVEVEKIATELLAAGFDYNRDESYETDPEKLQYATSLTDLSERWRKILKAQIISRYLDLKEDQVQTGEGKDKGPQKSDKELWAEAEEKITQRNRNFFNRMHQETRQDHYDRFFNAIARAFDPHTNYMPPANKEDFDIHMRGSLEGIGALLREEDGYIKVVNIIPGSASARQGRLEAEDIILEVGQGEKDPVEITDMRLRDAVRLIRGPKGTEVRLTVKKLDGNKEFISILRDVVQIEETFVKSTLIESPTGTKIGYVMIPSFYRDFEKTRDGSSDARNSTDDTRIAIEELKKQGIKGLILDLRNNGGGSLMDAVDTTGLFIKEGPVVLVKNSYGNKRVLSDEDSSIAWDGPLLVLVNQFSASASEILAAALQDYGRAVIVGGAHTHGKGTVQTLINMNENIPTLHLKKYDDLGALKVTIQKFYRVNGGSTQYKGVEPDIVLPSLFQHLESGEQYLDYSLPWDQVEPVSYARYGSTPVDLAMLEAKSRKRVQQDEGLQVIADEADKASERVKKTTISLKLSDMKEKRLEAKVARDKIGAHYLKYREEQDLEHGDSSDVQPDNGKDKDKWKEEIKEDPYINESLHILDDM